MSPQILLAVADEERRVIYEAFIKREQVDCHVVSSLREVATQATLQPFKAIFLDMPIILRASRNEKYLVEDALLALPSVRLNIASKTKQISMLTSWEAKDGHHAPEDHLRYCCEQPEKIVLPRNRAQININATLAFSSDMASAQRTFSVDVSTGGCFLFSADEAISLESQVWISFANCIDPAPILSSIRWKRLWGRTNEIPGIGVSFIELSKIQHAQIMKLCEST